MKIQNTESAKVRIGSKKDGGYVLPIFPTDQTELLLTFGVSDDIDFELDFVNQFPSAKIHLFDHTVDGLPKDHSNFYFSKTGIGPKNEGPLKTLSYYLNELDPGNNLRKVLKMDIEYNEWSVIESLKSDELEKFEVIIIELHLVFVEYLGSHSVYFTGFFKDCYRNINEELSARYVSGIQKLQETHTVVHAHVNNSLPSVELDLDGTPEKIPQLVELTLVRNGAVKLEKHLATEFPIIGLDFPNKSDRPDYSLYGNSLG